MTVKQVFVLWSDSNFELSSPIFGKGGGDSFHILLNIYTFFFQEKHLFAGLHIHTSHPFSVTILYVYGVNV